MVRPALPSSDSPVSPALLRDLIADALQPGYFLVIAHLALSWHQGVAEEIYWEIFRGRALDHTQTRQRCRFESWNIVEDGDDEPLLSAKLDERGKRIHVTRSILCHAFESYDDGGRILSRETIRRIRELVGTIDLTQVSTASAIRDELITLLSLAVSGTSRLPLTSLEAPLPAFALGRFAYCRHREPGDRPIANYGEWIEAYDPEMNADVKARFLESLLRATPAELIPDSASRWPAATETSNLVRATFNNVALSPYTDFVAKTLAFIAALVDRGAMSADEEADLLTHLLRQTGRHLTAFDLVRFHHRGANYPDALMVEEISIRLAQLINTSPAMFLDMPGDSDTAALHKRLRRRGVRWSYVLRLQYRNHSVPDVPTSPGENARVLPAPHQRIGDDQFQNVAARSRRLFAKPMGNGAPGDAWDAVISAAIQDLEFPVEARELGVGIFLDRPLGFAKSPGEPDATLLMSHLAFSSAIAEQRHRLLRVAGASLPEIAAYGGPAGVPIPRLRRTPRPGVVSIEDARLASEDFVFIRTTARTSRDLLAQYDLGATLDPATLGILHSGRCLVLPESEDGSTLSIRNDAGTTVARLGIDVSQGFVSRAGIEYVRAGLTVSDAAGQRRALPRLP